jgi:murein DD-endopeptidase MepM/ murein hydrolase activator NlpD
VRAIIAGLVLAALAGVAAQRSPAEASPAARPAAELTPVIESVPSVPRWYRADDGRVHLQYELMLTNTLPLPVRVDSIEVRGGGRQLETLSGDGLVAAMSPLGTASGSSAELPPATVAVAWIDLSLRARRAVPRKVSHRLTVDVGPGLPVGPTITSTGGFAETSTRAPVVIGPPLSGGRWVAVGGPDGPHRRALQAVNGRLRLSQRFAVDFSALLDGDGRTHVGPADQNSSYFNYGRKVLAVGAGKVVESIDDRPDQIPNNDHPLPLDQADGNSVILKLGDGVFVGYAHLMPGTVRVRRGERVRAGQVLGLLGNSGASTGPHLHLQLMNRPSFGDADGLPFEFASFRFDGVVPSLVELIDTDLAGTPVPIDPARAGKRHRQGIAGLSVVTFPSD